MSVQHNLKRRSVRRPMIFGAVVGAVISIATAATAAVLTLGSTAVVSGAVMPSSCDTAYEVLPGDPAWNNEAGDYLIGSVVYRDVNSSCAGHTMKIDVLNADGESIASTSTEVDRRESGELVLSNPVEAAEWVSVASVLYLEADADSCSRPNCR